MKQFRRMIGLIVVALLLTIFAPNGAWAQDPNTITIDGSALVSKVLDAAKTAYAAKAPDTKLEIGVSGTGGGFEKFCNGTLDIAMAYGAISEAQFAACQAQQVNFVELLLGYNAIVIAVNNTSPATCLDVDQLKKLLGANATGVNDWNTIDPAISSATISAVYGPPNNPDLPERFQLSRLIGEETLRSDYQPKETADEVVDRLVVEPTSVGILLMAEYQKNTSKPIKALQVKNAGVCIDPLNIANLDEGRYLGAEALYLYANAASLDRKPVADFLNYLLGSDGRSAVASSGYLAATATLYDRDLSYLAEKRIGRTFSRVQAVNIPADTAGTVNVGGSPSVYGVFARLNETFSPRYTSISVNVNTLGNDAGYRRLCQDQVDILGVTRAPNEAEASACQLAEVQTLQLRLGAEALVIVVNAGNDFAVCLAPANLERIFSGNYKSTKWSQVALGYPELDMLVLTPREGAAETDLLLTRIVKAQVAPPPRLDTEANADAQYRAAAVQNVPGGVTFMTFSEFQKTTSKVRAVAIDGGNGCVAPSEQTILDGTYPLSVPLSVVFNLKSFARPEVRAYVWYLLSDDAPTVLQNQGVVGASAADFASTREIVLERFTRLEQAAATPAPTVEATPAATQAATPATAEPTTEPTAAPTEGR